MKKMMILAMILIASTAFAGQKKKAPKGTAPVVTLEEQWDADPGLLKLDCNDNMCVYGVKGSAQIVDADNNVRSAWVAFLYTEEGRKALKGQLKGSYYSKEKWNFNCNDVKMNISAIHYYDAKGTPLSSFSDDEQWSDIVPGSFGETVAAIVCTIEDNGDEDDTPGQGVPGEEPAPQEEPQTDPAPQGTPL